MTADPHTAVKQELLVRYLDFWIPAALPAGRATYLDASSAGPAAALRVVGEFADLLPGRELAMLVAGSLPADPELAGLRLAGLPDDPVATVRAAGRSPVLAHLDYLDGSGGLAGSAELPGALAAAYDGELLRVTAPQPGDPREELYAAGFRYAVAAELVDEAGRAQLLCFATSTTRSLERFKDELWAVDEFAGVRYRDPVEPEAVPLDISIEPYPGPLRRALLAQLAAAGAPQTVNELREFTLARTLYRPSDVLRALNPLLARGALTREPARGRLTGTTQLRLPG